MNLRQFFISHVWWGKLIGAFFGYLMAGPAGALFGILIGNLFDKGLQEHFTRPFWFYHSEKNRNTQETFFSAIFSVLGHIAKADGRVSENSIRMANDLMQRMHLNTRQKKAAQTYFSIGKSPNFNLKQTLISLQKALHGNAQLTQLFIDTQYQAVQVDGLSQKKIEIMNTILNFMQLASLHEQNRFAEDFGFYSYKAREETPNYSSHQYKSYQSPTYTPLDNAFALLNVKSTATKQEVKRAYRRLISQNHPDKLIAKGVSENKIKEANEKTQKIRKAYELICSNKGW